MKGIQWNIKAFLLLFGFIECTKPPFVDISSIKYGYSKQIGRPPILTLNTYFDGYIVSLNCTNCKGIRGNVIDCTRGTLVDSLVTITKERKSYIVPVNASCDNNPNLATVSNISASSAASSVELSWDMTDTTINTYIIYYTDHTDSDYRIISPTTKSYFLDRLKEKTWYQMCIATITTNFITGQYRCIMQLTDFSVTGPVTDIRTEASKNSVTISWKKPLYSEDNPNAYIVRYKDQIGSCKSIIITMSGSPITNDAHCTVISTPDWTHLQKLVIQDLSPFTTYNITISSLNKGRLSENNTLSIKTKDGKSEAVPSIDASIIGDWLRITYSAPSKPNGIITKYRVKIVLVQIEICSTVNEVKYDYLDVKENYKYIFLSDLKQCSQYRIEVYPINGWIENNGEGEMNSTIFQYKPVNTLSSSSIRASFISSNLAQISWDHDAINEYCQNVAYMVEVRNKKRHTDCNLQILSNENCTALDKISNHLSNCSVREFVTFNRKYSSLVSNIGAIYVTKESYNVILWKITHLEAPSLISDTIVGQTNDCFTDCYTKTYIGIRSEEGCVPWNVSGYAKYRTNPNILNNFCTMDRAGRPWCPTGSSYNYCIIPKCSSKNTTSGCIRDVNIQSSTSSVHITWITPHYQGSILGYITLLFSKDKECLQSKAQCDGCKNDLLFGAQVRNFYITCRSRLVVSGVASLNASFDNLDQNKKYNVYIIPLLGNDYVGSIKKVTHATLLAKPHTPNRILISERTKTSHLVSWTHSNDLRYNGPTDLYLAMLTEWNNLNKKTIKIKTNNYKFTGLKMCTKYCVQLQASNNAGLSHLSDEVCAYTIAPRLETVYIGYVQSGLSSTKEISWTYNGNDNCPRNYTVEYVERHYKITKEILTMATSIKIEELILNRIYDVRVRARTNLDTENKVTVGFFSHKKEFYTGIKIPKIYKDSEYTDPTTKQLNITWSFDSSQNGSVFEFIVLIKNQSKKCVLLKNLVCEDCPHPYKRDSLNDSDKTERQKILKCDGPNEEYFKQDKYSFTVLFNMVKALGNYTFEIYAINLIGIHKIKNQDSWFKPTSSSASLSLVLCIMLIIIVLFIALAVMVKVKHRPKMLYNVIMKTKTQNGNIIKGRNIVQTNRVSDISATSIKNTSANTEDSNLLRISGSSLAKEYLPLLEPKRRSTGIPLKDFPTYYEKMSTNDNDLIILEYKKLTADCKRMEKERGLTVETGRLPVNAKKNRFINILPFDQTRVKIRGKAKNNYTNANYIPFMDDETRNEYIASQGPIEQSIDDFWQMIVTQNINCIVMLTRTMEEDKFKCLQYWPDNTGEEQTYGHNGEITVILESEVEHESHIERNILIRDEVEHTERSIVQLHMHTWFDHSAPNLEHFDRLLFRFHEIANSYAINPYLIHCSAGVGRTGTLICIDRIIKQLVNGCQEINIYETVFNLRHYRNFMVQRQAQYVFIHDYIDHFLKKYMKIEDTEETLYFNEE